jgi:hypothetical protein
VEFRLQIEGVLAYFTHLKCQKRIGKNTVDFKYVFTHKKPKRFFFFFCENDPLYVLSTLLCKNMTQNALKCILLPKKYLKFVKKFLCRSPKSMKGSQTHLALGLKNYLKPYIERWLFCRVVVRADQCRPAGAEHWPHLVYNRTCAHQAMPWGLQTCNKKLR